MPRISSPACAALLSLLMLLSNASALAQISHERRFRDSLQARLQLPALPDSQRVATLKLIGWYYRQTSLDSARAYSARGLRLARRIGYLGGELGCLNDLAVTAYIASDYVRAERLTQELLRRLEGTPARMQRFRAEALGNIGNIALAQGDKQRAAYYYRQRLHVALHGPLMPPMVKANAYLTMLAVYTEQLRQQQVADSTISLARRYARAARRINAEAGNALGEGTALHTLALAQQASGQPDSAAATFRQTLALYQENESPASEVEPLCDLASLQLRQRHVAAAARLAKRAAYLAQQVDDAEGQYQAYDVLAQALAAQGLGLLAYETATAARRLRDSLQTVNNAATLANLQVRYETERKEARIHELSQQQRLQQAQVQRQRQSLWALVTVLLVLTAGMAAVLLLYRRLRHSQAELAAAQASKDRLYALVAHDLRSPVVAFQGLAGLLTRYVQRQDTERLAGLGGRINQAAQHLSELLDNLLNWAMSQRGELRPTPTVLPAQALLQDIADLYANAALAADVALRVEAPPGLCLLADDAMTRTILRNLVGNALRATPPGGTITLAAAPDGERGRLLVRDAGPGFPPQVLTEAQGPLRVAAQGQGSGLGLRLSRTFAQSQGGTLVLANHPAGGGLATLTLPAAAVPARAAVA